MDYPRADRRLRWVSSVAGDPGVLGELNRRMTAFYREVERRARYQDMLDTLDDEPAEEGSVADRLIAHVVASNPATILEVGCGNGRMYRQFACRGYARDYLGVELSEELIQSCERRHPDARWAVASGYEIPVPDGAADACVSFYVLEHAVYPERMLREMLRVTAPGGTIHLVFPDFAAAGFLPSQQTGLSPGSAREKIHRGQVWDAGLTMWDSRISVRPTIRRAADTFGPFPVNTRPLCLDHPGLMWADIDAVYVANKSEVAAWLRERHCMVEFPAGTSGLFSTHAYLCARLPGGPRTQ